MQLRPIDSAAELAWVKANAAVPDRTGVLEVDAASVLYIDDNGKRYRLPKGPPVFDKIGGRICREVATERDLFNCHGTFYELPAENASGFARVRPVATHNRHITDYCSYRGLMVISGIANDAPTDNPHMIRSEDGKTALWVGAIDDMWEFGKPAGRGGPWLQIKVKAGEASDPYLMTGYDKKTLTLSASGRATITAEIDITGVGEWHVYKRFAVEGHAEYRFPSEFQAYWIRFVSDQDTIASAQLVYE